jgi:hypothetical protein
MKTIRPRLLRGDMYYVTVDLVISVRKKKKKKKKNRYKFYYLTVF